MFDPLVIKSDFPILSREINGKPLVYLDSAATSQKPIQVIDAISDYYKNHNANVHRGVHTLSDESTHAWHESRKVIADFFGATDEELILVRNTTEAINAVRYGWLDSHLEKDDVTVTTIMEHHSNIVMWQEAARKANAHVKFIKLHKDGTLDLEHLREQLTLRSNSGQVNEKLRMIALTHVSNALGTVNPIKEIVEMVKKAFPDASTRPKIVVDGAQSAPHMPINFHDLDVDFFAFSGHKMLGPMGIGGLLVRKSIVESGEFKPWLFGGGMISEVHTTGTVFHDEAVERFTAGTPDVASAVGLAAACKYLSDLGMKNVLLHDQELVHYAIERLSEIPELTVVGITQATIPYTLYPIPYRVGSVAFVHQGVHAHDVAQILDSEGIAVRSGHHCTMPLHEEFGWQATTRASFNVYSTKEDIDALVAGLEKVKTVFKL